jgi:hypothetical protein
MQKLTGFEKATLATTGMVSAVAVMAGSAAAQDFDGFYMGLSASSLSGDNPWDPSWSNDYQMEGDATVGGFIGFNKSVGAGNLVLGGEIAMQGWTPGDENGDSSYEEYGINSAIDLKMRVGTTMAMGSAPVLLYGFAGVSSVNHSNYYGAGYTSPGMNYGVGAEMKIGSTFGIGVEYLTRSMDAYDGEGYEDGSNSHNQLTLRAALHF